MSFSQGGEKLEKKKPHTSSAVKDRYNKKVYDTLIIRVKKGNKDLIKNRAEELNKSLNTYVTDLIFDEMKNK